MTRAPFIRPLTLPALPALASAVCLGVGPACSTDQRKTLDPAGALGDAGPPPDAGVIAVPGAEADGASGVGPPAGAGGAFDRILVKPKDPSMTADAVASVTRERAGLEVTRVRRTAGKWFMVQLAPAAHVRTAEEQLRAVTELQRTGAFEHVEPDRLMQVGAP